MRYILIVALCCGFTLYMGCESLKRDTMTVVEIDKLVKLVMLDNSNTWTRLNILDARLSALESEARKARKIEPYDWNGCNDGLVITGKVWVTNAPVKLPVNTRPYRLEDYGGKLVPNAEVKE